MNKRHITFYFLLLASATYAQSLNLLEQNKIWTVEYADYVTIPPQIDQLTYKYSGDTVVNQIEYHLFGNSAILREDTLAGKVFLYADDSECLLYDFKANVGDTLNLCYDIDVVIENITLAITNDDQTRKMFHVSGTNAIGLEYYIQGIGSNLGFVELSEIIGPPTMELMCVKKNNYEIFGDRCDEVISSTFRPQPIYHITLFPNPVRDIFNIDSNLEFFSIEFRDISGRIAFTEKFNSNTINLGDVSPGLYFVLLSDEAGNLVAQKRLVVE